MLALFVEQLAAQREQIAAYVPAAVVVDLLLRELHDPLPQRVVARNVVYQRIGAARQYRRCLDLDVVVEVDSQLADEGPQYALEEFVDGEYGEP